jgi:hypothetical protein
MLLRQAIRAGLPLVQADHRDAVYFDELVLHLTRRKIQNLELEDGDELPHERGGLYWTDAQIDPASSRVVHQAAQERGATLVTLNQRSTLEAAFQVGPVLAPTPFLIARLRAEGFAAGAVSKLSSVLGGLTAREAIDLAKVAQATRGHLDAESFWEARQLAGAGRRGVRFVLPDAPPYRPDDELGQYLAWAGPFLLGDHDERLRPRGALLHGPPGTGKTSAAKRAARELGLPLLRLDVGACKGSLVGESEAELRESLAFVDAAAPCVLLIDEVEKLFQRELDGGTTSTMLADLLWWLAERRSRVLVIMTTNDRRALPPELIRAGRLDQEIETRPLDECDGARCVAALAADLAKSDEQARRVKRRALTALSWPASHATVAREVLSAARATTRRVAS